MKNSAPIEKGKNAYYKTILEQIRRMFIEGELSCGQKMPSERELAELFQVSRVPVREALKILEYMGVLENVPGEGQYIRNISIADVLGKLDFAFVTTSRTILDLLEMRISLEATAAFYAAQRRTDDDIEAMKKAIDDMRRALNVSDGSDEDEALIRDASHAFHINLVKASKNSVLFSVYENLYDLLDISKQYTLHGPENASYHSLLAHEAILGKIVMQDAPGAQTSMNEHLEAARVKLKGSIAQEDEQSKQAASAQQGEAGGGEDEATHEDR